jgi:integrase
MTAEAHRYRDALRRAKTPEDRMIVEDDMQTHVFMQGYDNTDPDAQRFYGQALGSIISTGEHLDEWIGSLQVKGKTAKMRRSTIERLGAKFPTLRDINRKVVRHWVTEMATDLKAATVQRMMSDCRTYWKYLATVEAVPEDSAPFDRLGLKVKQSSWKPYEPKDAVRLLKAAEGDTQLADLIRMAMYTGARREELCSLKVVNVKGDRFEIVGAKTEAGIRTVPIHRRLATTIRRLVKASKDGYVLSGLSPNRNDDRGDAIGKRFTRLKRSLDFDDRHTFHSWRGTVITMLEHAGVPEGTVQDIVGHERHTLTGSIYSAKSTFEMRKAAIKKLVY